jgi:hypothetical protein
MMAITHAMVGMLLAIPVAVVAPEFALAAATGGLLGGVVPDLDLFVGVHRRTLHFPVAGPVIGGGACLVAVASPSTLTVGAAVFLLSAGLHASTDVLGAGEELRPWERTNPFAVYDHVRGRWLRARYLIRRLRCCWRSRRSRSTMETSAGSSWGCSARVASTRLLASDSWCTSNDCWSDCLPVE